MELSPEERRRIYEEEKARIDAREQIEREKRQISQETSVKIEPNVAGLLCYLGGWITGLIFFILEQKNNWIRYHAAQSILVFGTVMVAGIILRLIPYIGVPFSGIVYFIGFVLWIVLMVKAYNGERYKLAIAGDIAERMVSSSGAIPEYQKPPAPPEKPETPPPPQTSPDIGLDKKISNKVEEFFERKKAGRMTASAFAIAWSIILLIFFNYFYEYVAYYSAETVGNVVTWTRYTFFTSEIAQWLPILTATLVISIIGHIVLIVFDRYLLRKIILFIIDAFGLATVVTLVSVFPFDFSVIPNQAAAAATQVGVTVVLICIAVGLGISLIVRLIKVLVDIAKGTTQYQ